MQTGLSVNVFEPIYMTNYPEVATKAGKLATALLREHGLTSPNLSGIPRARKPKGPKEQQPEVSPEAPSTITES